MSFTPKWYPGGWVEWAPDKFASCGLLDEGACLLMASEMASDPTLQPVATEDDSAPLAVTITDPKWLWGKTVFLAGVSLLALAAMKRG